MKDLDEVQQIALKLIQSDASVIYNICVIYEKKLKNTNNICMLLPYIGLFTFESENWGNKVKLKPPKFSEVERNFHCFLRNDIKIFNNNYQELKILFKNKIEESDNYYFENRSFLSILVDEYYNIGADKLGDLFCGNTILIYTYLPMTIEELKKQNDIYKLSIIIGRLCRYYKITPIKEYNTNSIETCTNDFNWYTNTLFKDSSIETLCYFSILCCINFIIEFIENLFIEEIPQKFKWAYLLYYYLCDLVDEINKVDKTIFKINTDYKNREFRNCIAHYGLRQFIKKEDIVYNDILFGLTQKGFNKDYFEIKEIIYAELKNFKKQIEQEIFNEKYLGEVI